MPLELERLVDVSSQLVPQYGKTTYIEESNVLVAELRLSNNGSNAVEDELIAVVTNLSNPSIGVLHPDGYLASGLPYFHMRGEATNGWLAHGQRTETREIRFAMPSREQFDFDIAVLARPNSAPTRFLGSPLREIEAGHSYAFTAQAIDLDHQTLTYTVVAAQPE